MVGANEKEIETASETETETNSEGQWRSKGDNKERLCWGLFLCGQSKMDN